jgi:hypothetical protein
MNPLTRFQSMLPKKEQQKIEKLKTPWRTVYIKNSTSANKSH